MSKKPLPKFIVLQHVKDQKLEDAVKSLNLETLNKNSVIVSVGIDQKPKYRFVDCDEWNEFPIFIGIERTRPLAYAFTEFLDILLKSDNPIIEIKPMEFYAERYFRQEINWNWHKIRLHLTNKYHTCQCLSERWEWPEFRKCPTGLCRLKAVNREVWIAASEVEPISSKHCMWLNCHEIAQFERKAYKLMHERILQLAMIFHPLNPAEFSLFSIVNFIYPAQYVKRSNKINSIAAVQRSIAKIIQQREDKKKIKI